jgi:hypothetical protein
VPDPDGEAYDAMLRQYRASKAGSDALEKIRIQPGRPVAGVDHASAQYTTPQGVDWDRHPGLGESLIPVWGSAREAYADYHDGNYLGAGLNAALALSDIAVPGGFIGKGLEKAGVRTALDFGKSAAWKNVRRRMGTAGHFGENEVGHHWLIPQRAKWVPERIRNHPANIMRMEADVHKRIHSADRIKNLPRFTPAERLVRGTPTWAKANVAKTSADLGIKIGESAKRHRASSGTDFGTYIASLEAR